MRYNYVEPIIETVRVVLGEILRETIHVGEPELCSRPILSHGVTTAIGVTGDATGLFMLDMEIQTARALARTMGVDEAESSTGRDLSATEVDAVGELSSMLVGRAVGTLYDRGHSLHVTPVTLYQGKDARVSMTAFEALVFALDTNCGRINVNLSMTTSLQEGNAHVTT